MTSPDLNAESLSVRKANPYVGPGPFSRRDESRFFGRKREIADLQSLVAAHRTVLLYSQSGAGKSSLLNAGLIPRLEVKDFDVMLGGRLSQSQPEDLAGSVVANIYSFNAISTLLANFPNERPLVAATIAEVLRTRPRRFIQKSEGLARMMPRVLVLDQFEELLRCHPEDWKKRRLFCEQLAVAMQEEPTLRILLAMREDFVAALDQYDNILPEGFRTRYRLEMLRPEAALLAIGGPLEGTGVTFSAGVAERLITDLRTTPATKTNHVVWGQSKAGIVEEFIEPVQLQVVCFSLFRKLKTNVTVITDEDRAAFGNVDLALRDFYENALQETSERTGIAIGQLRAWFESELITEEGSRGLVLQRKETTAGMRNDAISLLDETFHIIRPADRLGGIWYEISHDRFIQPILRANDVWREEEKAQNELQQIEERRKLAAEVKRSKLRARQYALLAAAALIALVLAIVMTLIARKEKSIALSQQLALQSESQLWRDPKAGMLSALQAIATYPTSAAKEAVQQALIQSNVKAVFQASAPLSSVAFSRDGKYIISSTYAGDVLVWETANRGHSRRFESTSSFRASMDSISKDGRYLLVGVEAQLKGAEEKDNYESRLVVYDLDKGIVTGCAKANDINGDITSAVFSPDGDFIATGSEDYTVRVWDAKKLLGRHSPSEDCDDKGLQLRVKNLHLDIINSVRFDFSSSHLAISTHTGPAVVWDWKGDTSIALHRYSTSSLSAEFDPTREGSVLVAGQDGFLTLWNLQSPQNAQTRWSRNLDVLPILQASFDPTGEYIVTPSIDDNASVLDIKSVEGGSRRDYILRGHHGPVTGVAFSSDGKSIATASVGAGGLFTLCCLWKSSVFHALSLMLHELVTRATKSLA